MKRVLPIAMVIMAISCGAFAQVTPVLLKDLNGGVIPNSTPYGFVRASTSLYFAGNPEAGAGNFPIITDGTAEGTDVISGGGFEKGLTAFAAAPFGDDIILMDYTTLYKVGRNSVTELMSGFNGKTFDKLNQYSAFQINGKLFFWADAASSGVELYVTDGTSGGTALFKDFSSTWGSSNPGAQKCYFKYEDRVYFLAKVEGDMELWKTDGTEVGTKAVASLLPGITGDFVKFPFDELVDGKIFIAGAEKFLDPKTDELTDLGVPQVMENSFRLMNGKVYFLGLTNGPGPTEYTIYSSDASGKATQISSEVVAGAYLVPNFVTTSKTDVNGKVIFIGKETEGDKNYQIWATDGTKEGTEILNNTIPKSSPVPTHMYCCGDKVYMLFGKALWVTDGTVDGTKIALEDPNNPAPNYYMDERSGRMYLAYKETNKIGTEPYYFDCGSGIQSGIRTPSAKQKDVITLYPNPGHGDHVQLNIRQNGLLQVFDLTGALILSQWIGSGNQQLSLPNLQSGIYVVSLSGRTATSIQKLIVQ